MYLSAHSAWRWIVAACLIPLFSRWQIWHWAWLEICLNFNFCRHPELRKVLKNVDGEAHGWPRAKDSDWYTRNKSLYVLNNKTLIWRIRREFHRQAGKEVKRIKHIINLHPRSLEIDSAEVGLWDQARQPQHLPPENCSLKLWQAFCDPPPLIPIVPLGWSASLLGHVANIGKQAIQPWNFTLLKRKYWLVDWQVSRAATFQLAPNKFFEGRQGQKQQLEQSCNEHLSGLAISSPQQ